MAGTYPGIVKTKLDGVNQFEYLTGKFGEVGARYLLLLFQGPPIGGALQELEDVFRDRARNRDGLPVPGVQTQFAAGMVNLKRDPFETWWGDEKKATFWFSGALAGPVTAYIYDWNLLPIGQVLWLKELETYEEFPPLQDPASYNLDQVMEQLKKGEGHPSRVVLGYLQGRAGESLQRVIAKVRSGLQKKATGPVAGRSPVALHMGLAESKQRPPTLLPGGVIFYARRLRLDLSSEKRSREAVMNIFGARRLFSSHRSRRAGRLAAMRWRSSNKSPTSSSSWAMTSADWNISAYNRGMMGYRTPNIDRIANEGAIFTDYYGQQSCTAGRAAFITGQSPLRTGLLKVGLPGAKEGLSEKDPTIAELLKPQGYATGQFGKNHLGDRNEFLPTVHGFDEFFGNLYHLERRGRARAPGLSEEPRASRRSLGPRGVLKCVATATDTPGDDPRFGPWGKQKCEDTGPLTKKRMETIDEEFLAATLDFIDRANRDQKPFFVWFNPSRMHIWTRLKPGSQGKTGLGIYPDGMVEHDGQVGQLLKKLDDLGIANNTIVIYTTDNGAETFSWPDGGTTPFRGEKNTNWEGGYRVPAMVALARTWCRRAPRSTTSSPPRTGRTTLVAAAGEPDIKNKLLQGYERRRQDLPGSPRRL